MIRLIIASTLLATATFSTPAGAITVSDPGAAIEYCDTTALQRVEGIWEMTVEKCTLLISCREGSSTQYDVTVLSSEDTSILPGALLGTLTVSANPDEFLLTLKTGFKLDAKCKVTITEDDMAITIERPSHKLKLSPYMLLHRFWGLFRYESDTPASRIRNGMVRIYPRGVMRRANGFRLRYL